MEQYCCYICKHEVARGVGNKFVCAGCDTLAKLDESQRQLRVALAWVGALGLPLLIVLGIACAIKYLFFA